MYLTKRIKELAYSNGIDLIGIAGTEEFNDYILKNSNRRDPKLSLPDAKSIIVIGIYIGGVALTDWDKPNIGRTSRLFLSGFFNNIVKQLKPITDFLNHEGYEAIICDDSENGDSILPLKLAAIRAGFGWQGKNSLLINKKYGSFLALGGILTNAALDYNSSEEVNRCKSCNKCQQACPTKALDESYLLDKNKCLSYLLQNDNFPEEAKPFVKNRVMDCEICQEACPWNIKHIKNPLNTELTESFKNETPKWIDFFSVSKLMNLTEPEYKVMLEYLDTGVAYELFRRNVEMVYENYSSLNR